MEHGIIETDQLIIMKKLCNYNILYECDGNEQSVGAM